MTHSRKIQLLSFIVSAFMLSSCSNNSKTIVINQDKKQEPGINPWFRELSTSAGLNYEWKPQGKRPLNILQTIGNGCAFFDYDNDGNLDILLVGPKPGLFKGDGKGRFLDVSLSVLGTLTGSFLGCAIGDYDNDGYTDIYLSGYREGRLLHNEKGLKFSDQSSAVSLPKQEWGTSASWVDINRDGFLDLIIANYVDFSSITMPQLCLFPMASDRSKKIESSCGPKYYQPIKARGYENSQGKKFIEKTNNWGIQSHTGKGLGIAVAELDEQGHQSIAVANDEVDGNLFYSDSPSKLRDIAVEAGIARDRDGMVHAGMGIDWGDYNNDGRYDLIVTTFRNEAKSLYRNDGNLQFTDVSYPSGIGRAAFPYVSFGVKFLDADNDGNLDIVIASGHVQDNIEKIEDTSYRQPLVFSRNNGSGIFEDKSVETGIQNIGKIVGRGLATGDYDNDGRVDILVVDSEGKPLLIHNECPISGHWVLLNLQAKNNRSSLGAQIKVTVDETNSTKKRVLLRQCQSDGSYLSASDSRVHFGLGSATQATASIRWPDGSQSKHTLSSVDKVYILKQP